MSERINNAVGLPAAAAQLFFPVWWPGLDSSADVAAKLIPIFGAITGAILAANYLVTLIRNIRAARAEREGRDDA